MTLLTGIMKIEIPRSHLTGIDLEFYTSTICFHAQQAVEKFLKAFLIYHDVVSQKPMIWIFFFQSAAN